MNRDGNKRPDPSFFLEEYIDPAFRSIKLPSFLQRLNSILVGDNSDTAFANYRLWQYMKLLHSTEFSAYVYELDPRVTYLEDRSVVPQQNSSSFTPNAAATGVQLYFIGEIATASPAVKLYRSWELEVLAPLYVRSTSLQNTVFKDTVVTMANNMSSEIFMAGQGNFGVRVVSDPLPFGGKWLIEAFAFPSGDLTDLVAPLTSLLHGIEHDLFPNVEPYKTFSELWNKHNIFAYRLSGLLLAYAYQIEKVRLNA